MRNGDGHGVLFDRWNYFAFVINGFDTKRNFSIHAHAWVEIEE